MSIKLADALRALRQQLNEARLDGEDEPIRFQLGPITLELKVQVETATSASGKVGLDWILASFKGEVRAASENAQTITLTLSPLTVNPISRERKPAEISDQVPMNVK
jgi:hypothetical protein